MFNEQTMRMLELCLDTDKSNKEVAHELQVDRKAIGAIRRAMGVKPRHGIFRASDMEVLMDSTISPSIAAKIIGCNPSTIWLQRKKLGFYRKFRKRRYAKKTTTDTL